MARDDPLKLPKITVHQHEKVEIYKTNSAKPSSIGKLTFGELLVVGAARPGRRTHGIVHEKTESAFVEAMARAKWPTHYVGMTSLSGKERASFLTSYDSFEAWEKDRAATAKNTVLSSALDRDSMADRELLDSVDESVFVFHQVRSDAPEKSQIGIVCPPVNPIA